MAGIKAAKHRSTERKDADKDDWSAFDRLADMDIENAVSADPDAAPLAGDDFWSAARVVMPVPKKAISIRLDEDVLAWFKSTGPGYQGRINAVLRAYMDAKKRE